MNNLGSNSSIYNDHSLTITERTTRLLIDTLIALHDGLLEHAVEHAEEVDLSKVGPQLDLLVQDISEVRIAGPIERETHTDQTLRADHDTSVDVQASLRDIEVRAGAGQAQQVEHRSAERVIRKGNPIYYVHFGSTSKSVERITELLNRRVWLLLDEWSSVPLDLQPYLSDLLRRTLFSNPLVTVKIAAIEHRSAFQIKHFMNEYVGFELGADVTADINLDDFMVFDNDEHRSSEFFKEFLCKHLQSVSRHLEIEDAVPKTGHELVRVAFTQQNTFTEYVRAVEGVPRDAINIISSAAQKAVDADFNGTHSKGCAGLVSDG